MDSHAHSKLWHVRVRVILVRTIADSRPLWSLLDQWSDVPLFWVRRMPVPPQTCICSTLNVTPGTRWTPNLKIPYPISNIDARKKTKHMSARRIPRRFGMLASDFTQYQYLTTKLSMPCHIPVIPALLGCVRLIAVLKIEWWDFFEIQDLRAFDLDT